MQIALKNARSLQSPYSHNNLKTSKKYPVLKMLGVFMRPHRFGITT